MIVRSSPRHRSSASPTPHRALRARVLAALLAKGTPVAPHAVDTVIAAGEHLTGRPPSHWRHDDVEALAWFGLLDHAREVGEPLDGLAPAALQLMAVLDPDGTDGFVEVMAAVLDPTGASAPVVAPSRTPA